MTWYYMYGSYRATGNYNNVAMGGSPNTREFSGFNFTEAHAQGYGKGIEFFQNSDTEIGINLSLIAWAINPYSSPLYGQSYVRFNGTYKWFLDIWYKNPKEPTWQVITQGILVANHQSNQNLAYANNWQYSTINYTHTFSIPSDWSEIKFEVRGEEPGNRYQRTFYKQGITFTQKAKPWAIRKGGLFKSLNRESGFFKIRKGGQWIDKLAIENNKIRKSNTWENQNNIGG